MLPPLQLKTRPLDGSPMKRTSLVTVASAGSVAEQSITVCESGAFGSVLLGTASRSYWIFAAEQAGLGVPGGPTATVLMDESARLQLVSSSVLQASTWNSHTPSARSVKA